MKHAVILIAAAAVLVACGPKSARIPTDPDKLDRLDAAIEKLGEEDRALLRHYIARHTAPEYGSTEKPRLPAGKTVGAAIAEQARFDDEARALEAQREAARAKMSNAVHVTVTQMIPMPSAGYTFRMGLVVVVENRTGKDVAGVKGTLYLKDVFGELLTMKELAFDDVVAARASRTFEEVSLDLGYSKSDEKLAKDGLRKVRAEFAPDIVVFTDGSKMTLPEFYDASEPAR